MQIESLNWKSKAGRRAKTSCHFGLQLRGVRDSTITPTRYPTADTHSLIHCESSFTCFVPSYSLFASILFFFFLLCTDSASCLISFLSASSGLLIRVGDGLLRQAEGKGDQRVGGPEMRGEQVKQKRMNGERTDERRKRKKCKGIGLRLESKSSS